MQEGFHATPTFDLVGAPEDVLHDVVVISLDTVRADRLAVYGGRAETPNLSALAARGTRFDQAISHFPETALSHWSMLSGVLPVLHGNVPAHGGSLYPGPTLAELAQKQGYHTGAIIGGVTLTDGSSGLARGFDVYDDTFVVDPLDMRRPGAEVTEAALKWWAETPSPKLLFVHYFDAHFPYTPSPPWDTRYDPDYKGQITGSDADLRPYRDGDKPISEADLAHVLALYDGELSEQDAMVGPLLDALAATPTVVALTSDHGESFEHDYYFNHRAGLWDGVVHVPLIIAGPGVPAGKTVAEQVGLSDVTPTLLDLAGLPRDGGMTGESRVALMGAAGTGQERVISITDPWAEAPQQAIRTESRKLLNRNGTTEEFDLKADPGELSPLKRTQRHLEDLLLEYDVYAEQAKALQVEAPSSRMLGPGEAEQLEALGYLTPGGTPAPGQSAPRMNNQDRGKAPGSPPGTPPPRR